MKISQMTLATETVGSELIEIVQNGENRRILVSDLIAHGKSAYELAQAQGFSGTLDQWLESLVGPSGLKGDDGKSAYELALEKGFVGTLDEYIDSLKGDDGASAYEVALQAGYVGTIDQWLLSLKGLDGDKGDTGEKGLDGTSWLFLTSDPVSSQGVDGDFAINNDTREWFYKSEGEWVSLGKLLDDVPLGTGQYVRVNSAWQRLDRYDLALSSTTSVLDLSSHQVFKVDASVNRTLVFSNEPADDRAMVVVIHITGSTGAIEWPANIDWNNNVAPVLGSRFTAVSLLWTGSGWLGTVSAIG